MSSKKRTRRNITPAMADKKKRSLQSRFEELDLVVPLDDEEADEILKAAGIDAAANLKQLLEKIEHAEEGLRKDM